MPPGFKIGWSLIVLGVALILAMPVVRVPRRAPETQHDRDEMWEYDATQWRQAVAFFIGSGVVAVGAYVLKNHGKA